MSECASSRLCVNTNIMVDSIKPTSKVVASASLKVSLTGAPGSRELSSTNQTNISDATSAPKGAGKQ